MDITALLMRLADALFVKPDSLKRVNRAPLQRGTELADKRDPSDRPKGCLSVRHG